MRSSAELGAQPASISTCVIDGLRFGCIRHWVVVTSVPAPSTVIEPPSNTIDRPLTDGRRTLGQRRRRRASSSYGQELVAPALNIQSMAHPRAVVVDHVDRPGVAEPRVVDRQLDDLDPGAAQLAAAPLAEPRRGDHRHRLEAGDRCGHLGVRPLARPSSSPR